MSTRHALVWLAVAACVACPARGQGDPAPFRTKAEAATKRVAAAQTAAAEQVAATRKSVGDDENKVQGDLDDIANKVSGQDFAAGLGSIPIAESHLEYVPEAARPAFQKALAALRTVLEAGAQARAQMDALQLLADRLENLQTQVKDGADLRSLLRDLEDTLNQARTAQALTQPEIAELRVMLAGHKTTSHKRRCDELREKVKADLAQIEAEYPAIQKALGERSERESAIARFDQMADTLRDGLLQLPAGEPATQEMVARLARLEQPVRETFTKIQAVATGERLKGNLDFQAYQFENWKDESGAVSAEDYLKIDCTVELLGYKKTAALIHLATPWFAFVAADAEYQRITPDPKFVALHASTQKDCAAALARMLEVAETLVAAIEKAGIEEQVARDRAAWLVDWDLRMVLQEHPKQWDLIARVQKLTDAFDRKTLGDAPAVAKWREEAAKSIDSHWARMTAALPLAGGFVGDQSGKFRHKFVRLQVGRNYADEFVPGDFDLVFRVDGELFAARYDPAVAAAVAAARARLQLAPSAADEYEIVAKVGDEATLGLPAADGKAVAATLPCRKLQIVGVRLGPIGFLAK